jgi:hypothetical protein
MHTTRSRSGRLRLRVALQHTNRVKVGGMMQADGIAAEHGRLAVTGDAICGVGNARPAGRTHNPFTAAGHLLRFHAGELRPLKGSLPALGRCLLGATDWGNHCYL